MGPECGVGDASPASGADSAAIARAKVVPAGCPRAAPGPEGRGAGGPRA